METLRRFKTILLPLCAVCLALAVWMLVHSLTGVRMVGCGPGGGCDSVMGSPWAYLLGGVPVSLPAVVTYVLLLVCLLFLGSDRSLDRLLWFLMPLLGGCIVGAALWFCFVQLFILRAFCPYCTAVHLLGCGAALWICLEARRQGRSPWIPLCAGLAAAALFALIQARTLPPAAYDKGETGAELPLFRGDETPVLGPADAAEELTLLFDFQCIHCRRLHRVLPELIAKSGDSLRIRLCPVPLSSSCNPYIPASGSDPFAGSCALTRLALAVWYAAPEKYEACWDALLGGGDEHRRVDPADAERLVRELLGASFEEACRDPRIDAYLKQVYELFGRTSTLEKSGVPRLVLGRKWLVPEVDDADALLSLIRNELQ
ncbi:MAG: hypothetical protein K5910_05020 [Bacteroidales bacterium]|nr:hypothetical protein [Bacteroidales bacterium]